MTLNEYRAEVVRRITSTNSTTDAEAEVREAARVLEQSQIAEPDRRRFWIALGEDLTPYQLLHERQAATSLSSIVAAAKVVISTYLASTPSR